MVRLALPRGEREEKREELTSKRTTTAPHRSNTRPVPFSQLAKVLNDNTLYAKLVLNVGLRTSIKDTDLSELFSQDNVDQATFDSIKELAEVSMGTEISEMDIVNIKALSEQVRKGFLG